MERLPLFNIFEMPKHVTFFEALQQLGPNRAWQIMSELAAADRIDCAANLAPLAERALSRMEMAPALEEANRETYARQFSEYGPRLQFECTFLMLWFEYRTKLMGEVVDIVGRNNLLEAAAEGNGVVALPLHVGASYAAVPLIAMEAPTTTLYNRMNLDELQQQFFPSVPLRGLSINSGSRMLISSLAELRSGRVLSMFPELDPHGIGPLHRPVSFLGTTVMAPAGPALLSQRAKAPMVPCVLRATRPGRFRLIYFPAMEPPNDQDGCQQSLELLWKLIEREVLAGEVGAWEMWHEFDDMLPPADRESDAPADAHGTSDQASS